ncbi:MAG TPA: nickel pincer cofactor biosynthesis protein LarC [Bryobacteraceae bacterium]|nr:nickel pincer cofactor biosynthesis protein LarC [Bryobacterales bacterium]HRJ21225.1 nickel pincer cofactor biosynthesis protein LarC [Bryobacteraceae bacterium]
MKIAYFDAFSGIAGDMTVGALIDAGADTPALFAGLDSLGTGARFRAERVKKKGIMGTQFTVEHEDQKKHRHLPHIVKMIEAAELPERAKRRAVRIFEVLGEAEAQVHGVSIEKVHFHEVGAVDSICDIVGAALGLELLGVDEVYVSAINTGSGTVEADHGVMPVPTPATALLLAGKPVYASGPVTELTTPTGAAIAAALGAGFGAPPAMVIEKTGFGSGTKEFPGQANLLRVLIGERSGASEATVIRVLEANVDDSTPEVLGYAMERLLAEGALDVTLQPVYMKKQRPGTLVQVLAKPEDQERLAAVLLRETSTLGIRISEAERRVAARAHVDVETEYGRVRMKVSGGGAAPEFEDCRRLAEATGQPLKEIFAAATAVYRKGNG